MITLASSNVSNSPGAVSPGVVDPGVPGASAPSVAVPPDAAASVPGAMDVVDPAKPGDPKADPNKPINPKTDPTKPVDPKADPSKDPMADPKTDPTRRPKDDPKQEPGKNQKGDKSQTDPPKPPLDPKAIKLPDDPKAANKMDFLQGDWKAGEGLVDKATKQPLDVSVKFGKDGKGEMTLRRPDGTVCSGPVQGSMNGGKLSVEGNQSVPCAGGGSYGAPRIECSKSSSGQTDCQGINRDGSRYYMDMRRQ